MNKSLTKHRMLLLLFFVCPVTTQAQIGYKQVGESYITIAGTSTLHDWTMTTNEPEIKVTFEKGSDGKPTQLKTLSLNVSIQSLKSAHKAMDKNAYSALKADKNKAITFYLTTATIQNNSIQFSGNLSIAGVTKPLSLESSFLVNADGSLNCTGKKALKMSDFSVEAPSFMFGSVKTGDDITISFNVKLATLKN